MEGVRPRGSLAGQRKQCQTQQIHKEDAMDHRKWRKLEMYNSHKDRVRFFLLPAGPDRPRPGCCCNSLFIPSECVLYNFTCIYGFCHILFARKVLKLQTIAALDVCCSYMALELLMQFTLAVRAKPQHMQCAHCPLISININC